MSIVLIAANTASTAGNVVHFCVARFSEVDVPSARPSRRRETPDIVDLVKAPDFFDRFGRVLTA